MITIKKPENQNMSAQNSVDNRRLRICHLSLTLCTGGLERLLVDFARYHDPAQFELEFIALGETGPPAEEIRKLGCPVIEYPLTAGSKYARINQLANFFSARNYDLLHTHNAYPHFYGSLAAYRAKIPATIHTRHGRRFGETISERLQFALASRFSNYVVPVSDDTGERCKNIGWLPDSKIKRIWNGIDVDRFNFTGPANELTAITVSRLSPEKDLLTMLEAVKSVINTIPQFRLMIVGDGPEREVLEQKSVALNLESHVTFLGERNDIPNLLSQAGFYVSSSLTEGISLTILEAMSVGLPVVTTAVGGNPEIVQQPDTGILVPSANASKLADAIADMCHQQNEWQQIGRNARNRVEQQFNIRSMIKEYESIYRSILTPASN